MALKSSLIEKYFSSSQNTDSPAASGSAAVDDNDLAISTDAEDTMEKDASDEGILPAQQGCSTDSGECSDLLLQPNQPRLKSFPPKQFGKNKVENRSFNSKWFDDAKWSSWLHWDNESHKAYCFVCRNVYLLKQSRNFESAFITTGFDTWKNATKAFEKHRNSACHKEAVFKWHHHQKHTNISSQLDKQVSSDQAKNRHCLEMLFSSIEYLARQALPFRGHIEERGNFHQLMALRGNDSECLRSWIGRRRAYMSHDIQNEILQIMGHQILKCIIRDVSSSNWFSIIADEATDAALVEQVRKTSTFMYTHPPTHTHTHTSHTLYPRLQYICFM